MIRSNFHAHSTFCDGAETPEAMVKAAIREGCVAFGISGHSWMGFETCWSMTREGERGFIEEMDRLKKAYADKLLLLTGLELDYQAPPPAYSYDYIIGAVHCIEKNGAILSVDESADVLCADVLRYFGGDFYAYTKAYYEVVADVAEKTNPDIVAHFDLVAKFNEGGRFFDETDRRYTGPALEALRAVTEKQKLFEINTGAMYRAGRSVPYPAPFFLRALRERGGEIILGSDSHDAASICYKFADMAELAKDCGFVYAKTLTADGFVEYKL